MQVLCSLYLSLKCANIENSFIFKNGEKEKNIKYSEKLYKLNETMHLGSHINLPEANLSVDHMKSVYSLCTLLFYLLKCDILQVIVL